MKTPIHWTQSHQVYHEQLYRECIYLYNAAQITDNLCIFLNIWLILYLSLFPTYSIASTRENCVIWLSRFVKNRRICVAQNINKENTLKIYFYISWIITLVHLVLKVTDHYYWTFWTPTQRSTSLVDYFCFTLELLF